MFWNLGPQFATFLVFGAMALLVFADFGGKTRDRLFAYVLTALAGVLLIVIGTLASASLAFAVGVTAVVAFGLAGMGVLGGYYLSAQTALMLAFVLSVTSAAGIDALPDRIAGWSTAGVAAVVAAWLLWPRSSHVALHAMAASTIRAVAKILGGPDQNAPQLEEATRQQLAMLQHGFVVAQRRPSGVTRRDRALAELAADLDRAMSVARAAAAAPSHARVPEAGALQAVIVRALEASADVLEGSGDVRDIEPLVAAYAAYRVALDRSVAHALQAGATAESVLEELAVVRPMGRMWMVALAIVQNAEIVAGLQPTGPWHVTRLGAWDTFTEELAPASIWLRNSLRTSLGVTLAVLVTGVLALSHAFWAVLGTLSALRSNASATGRTALEALAGTAIGVLIAMPFVGATGREPWLLWSVLPILVFLAAYTPAAVHFVVGQVAFSILVVVLFNILAPADWTIGLVRLQDAALGVAVGALVGLLLWPRGARGQLRSALAALYEAGAHGLSHSFRRMLAENGHGVADDATDGVHRDAETQAIRTQEVFELFLNERSRQSPAVEVWAMLLACGKGFLQVAEVVEWLAKRGYAANAAGSRSAVVGSVADEAVASILRMAEELRSGHALRVTEPQDHSAELRDAALASLSEPEVAASPEVLRSAIGLVATANWIDHLDSLLQMLESPLAETLAASRLPWWR
jgi:uncharacterized membrane protein YccC